MHDITPVSSNTLTLRCDSGREFLLSCYGLYFIGRDRACEISFPSDSQLSARHAAIFNDGKLFRIIDYKSSNGLTLNGKSQTFHTIKDCDEICLGNQVLVATLGGSDQASAPRLFELDDVDPIVGRLILLNRATASLWREHDPAALRRKALRRLLDLVDGDQSFLARYNTTPPFKLEGHLGFTEAPDILHPAYLNIIGRARIESRHIVGTRSCPLPDEPSVETVSDEQEEFDAYMALPMKQGSRISGMLYVNRRTKRPAFSREDLGLALAFMRYLVAALDTACLIQRNERGQ